MVSYFAYGSNTDLHALMRFLLRQGVDPAGVVDPHRAILRDYRMRTNYITGGGWGAANVERHKGSIVEGVVMQITPAVHDALRRKEGHPFRYRETDVLIEIPRTKQILPAMTYIVADDHRLPRNMPVSPDYRDTVLRGASAFRFSRKYQAKLRLQSTRRFARCGEKTTHPPTKPDTSNWAGTASATETGSCITTTVTEFLD